MVVLQPGCGLAQRRCGFDQVSLVLILASIDLTKVFHFQLVHHAGQCDTDVNSGDNLSISEHPYMLSLMRSHMADMKWTGFSLPLCTPTCTEKPAFHLIRNGVFERPHEAS